MVEIVIFKDPKIVYFEHLYYFIVNYVKPVLLFLCIYCSFS